MGELGFLGLSKARGLRRPGRRLLLEPGPRRGARRTPAPAACHGHRRAHRHGDAADPAFGTEEQKQDWLVPAIKGEKILCLGITEPDAGSDVSGDPDARRARRRRLRHQRLQDVHHQRPPRRRDRARDQDRPGRRLRRLHAVPRAMDLPGVDPREAAGEARDARLRHRAARLPGRPRPRDRAARPARQGLLPHHVGAPGRAADRRCRLRRGRPAGLRPHARLRAGAQRVRPRDRPLPGHPPQVRGDGDQDRGLALSSST